MGAFAELLAANERPPRKSMTTAFGRRAESACRLLTPRDEIRLKEKDCEEIGTYGAASIRVESAKFG
jgi:hypothetical protein